MRRALFLLLALSLALPLPAADPAPAGGDYDRLVNQGLTALYNLDYAGARASFDALAKGYPDSPMGAYAQCTALWWELTNEYDERNPELEKQFLKTAHDAAEAARAAVKKGDPDGQAHLALGGALGLEARWEAIRGEWLAAYRHGRQAFKAQQKAIEINPETYDAYLGVGIFHYYTATLPAVVKVLAKLMFGGNKQEGLSEIRVAMEKGRFSRTAAQLFMVGILINNEKKPGEALTLVRQGRKEFPASPFFHLLEMLTLEEAGDWDGVEREAKDFLAKIDAKTPFYGPGLAHRALFSLGNASLDRGKPADALAVYDRILKESPDGDRWITMTYLNRGRAHDRLGERAAAVADYKTVLARRDVWELHDKAKRYLATPDKEGDPRP
jgi:hypothetical protein